MVCEAHTKPTSKNDVTVFMDNCFNYVKYHNIVSIM